MLMTFANSPTVWTKIRTAKMSVLIWIQTIWHSDSVHVTFLFWKKSADDNKHVKNYPACGFKIWCYTYPGSGPPFSKLKTWWGLSNFLNDVIRFKPWHPPLFTFTNTNKGFTFSGIIWGWNITREKYIDYRFRLTHKAPPIICSRLQF